MNSMFFATLFCVAAFASAAWIGDDDGQWKGEGLAESQDYGQWNGNYLGNYVYGGAYAYGPAPIGHDGRVVDTPEVAQAKSAHFAAIAAAANGAPAAYTAWGPAVYGVPQVPLDTPEVAQAKAAHFAAHAAAANRW